MIDNIQQLIDDYHAWLKSKTLCREVGDWVEITTPYLDRHNDYVQIYAKQSEGGITLSDNGYTITGLEQTGCNLDSPGQKDLLRQTLNGFGVQMEGKDLQIHASSNDFPLKKHNLVQAILAVHSIFYLAAPMTARVVEPTG